MEGGRKEMGGGVGEGLSGMVGSVVSGGGLFFDVDTDDRSAREKDLRDSSMKVLRCSPAISSPSSASMLELRDLDGRPEILSP